MKIFAGVIGIFALLLLAGCVNQDNGIAGKEAAGKSDVRESGIAGKPIVEYRNVSAGELKQWLENKDFLLLDVHIPEQEHIEKTDAFAPYNDIGAILSKLPKNKDAKIVVYCRSGGMGRKASEELAKLGYSNVYNLVGGKKAYDALEVDAKANDKGGVEGSVVGKSANGNGQTQADAHAKLLEEVAPSSGVVLGAKWGDIGPKTIEAGALNYDAFAKVMERNGKPLTEKQKKILLEGSGENITISRENSMFVLNLMWAFGLVNNNSAYTDGPIAKYGDKKGNFASTGGWPLGNASGGELLGTANIIVLTQEQEALVKKITSNVYRPCCNNPAYFPDCNHGMAALALAQVMASQGAGEDEIYSALLYANSYWFPKTYVEMAQYFAEQGKQWKDVSPKQALGFEYSSASGYYGFRQKIKNMPNAAGGGGSCGV